MRGPLFVELRTDLAMVVDLMEDWRVRRLPVCEDGRLVEANSRGHVLWSCAVEPPPPRQSPMDGSGGAPEECSATATEEAGR